MTIIKRKRKIRTLVASMIICLLIIAGGGTAYATDVGGIQHKLQVWIHGEQTDVNVDFTGEGSYNYNYKDRDGNEIQAGGGGIAIENDGSERPLTDEELMEELMDYLDSPKVEYEEDGSVWIYYRDQKIDITDKFEDGICYAKLSGDDGTLYITIKYQNGYSISPHKYDSPSSFE